MSSSPDVPISRFKIPVAWEVVASNLPGDCNNDGTVDAADYTIWRDTMGDLPSYNLWKSNFGQTDGGGLGTSSDAAVPEPSTLALLALCLPFIVWRNLRRSGTDKVVRIER